MRQIIRNKIFETNSSSIHSISILNTNKKGKLEDLHYHIKFGKYDKDRQILSKPKDILNYFWTMLHSCNINLGNVYIELMKKWLINCTFQQSEIKDDYYDINGYIDHCHVYFETEDLINGNWVKVPSIVSELFESKETFTDIIFNGVIIIDSDWSHIYSGNPYIEINHINYRYLDNIEKDYYNSEIIPKNSIKTWIKIN